MGPPCVLVARDACAASRRSLSSAPKKGPAIAEAMPAGGATHAHWGDSKIPAHLVPRGGCAQSYTTAPVTGRPARARPRSRLAPEHVPLKFTHCRVELPTLLHPRGTEKSRLIRDGCVHGRVSYRRKSCRAGHKGGLALRDSLQTPVANSSFSQRPASGCRSFTGLADEPGDAEVRLSRDSPHDRSRKFHTASVMCRTFKLTMICDRGHDPNHGRLGLATCFTRVAQLSTPVLMRTDWMRERLLRANCCPWLEIGCNSMV